MTDRSEFRDKVEQLKAKLCAAKTQLDSIENVELITRALDPFKKEKYRIAKIIGEKDISNAWLKCFGIIMRFGLLKSAVVRHYDNAAFPGAFILAAKYVIKNYNKNCDYNWRACSLYDPLKPHLNDDYKLYEKHPDKWLMDEKNNGDITKIENINDIAAKLLNKTNFYTSDLGFDVSSNYNDQEKLHFCANTGQVLLCLKVLQRGGCCIIKHFTYFEEYTLAYLSKFSKLFENFYLYKPLASKSLNSEIYLVGINFLGRAAEKCAVESLAAVLEQCLVGETYSIDCAFPQKFVESIWAATKINVNNQIKQLNNVSLIAQAKNLKEAKKYRYRPVVEYNGKVLSKICLACPNE